MKEVVGRVGRRKALWRGRVKVGNPYLRAWRAVARVMERVTDVFLPVYTPSSVGMIFAGYNSTKWTSPRKNYDLQITGNDLRSSPHFSPVHLKYKMCPPPQAPTVPILDLRTQSTDAVTSGRKEQVKYFDIPCL